MLRRIAFYSLRSYRLSPTQPQLTIPSSRTYAKNTKAKKAFEYRAPTEANSNIKGPNTRIPIDSGLGTAGDKASNSTSRGSDQNGLPDVSNLQNEYDSILSSRQSQSTTRPLPDLTQGIPSTLESEISSSSTKADETSLNITEAPSRAGGQGGGDLPKSAYISSFERRRNRWFQWFLAGSASSLIVGAIYLGRNWENEAEELAHPDAPSGWDFKLFYKRAWARYNKTLDYYNEPAFPKLLPDTDPVWERPYTLVLSLEDLLVHSEWSREHGWRMAKRPGVDYFLRYLSQYYEIVVFTSVPSMLGGPIVGKLDPYKITIMWPLFREATRYQSGEYIKDLSFLNRPLNKIIMIDTVASHAKLQPENAIIIPKWKGDSQDKGLVSLIPFLEYIATLSDVGDTREVLKSYKDCDIPKEFARREGILRDRFKKQLEEERGKRPRRSMGILGSLTSPKQYGGIDGMEQSLSEGLQQGKTMQDIVRERGQKGYEMLEKEIRENGEKWLKDMAEEEKKMSEEAMKGMKSSILGSFPFGGGGSGGKS